MARSNYTFTSESVSEGHPDKVSDRISDEVVDLFYRRAIEVGMDPWDVRCAAETLDTTNRVVIAGEMRGPKGEGEVTTAEIEAVARAAIKDIGYEQDGFHHEHAQIDVLLHDQSAHIAQGVDDGTGELKEEGAGDQGIMLGYASNETEALMPAPLYYSHKILEELAAKRHSGELDQLGPDSKSQVSVVYENGKPVRASSIVLSTQHKSEDQTPADIRAMVEPTIRDVLPDGWITEDTAWHVAQPLSIYVDTGGQADDAKIEDAIRKVIDLTPRGIRTHLDLNKPIYAKSAAYGHFGRTPTDEGHFSWEKTDLVDALKAAMAG